MANEDMFYAQVANEISSNQIDLTIWTKALAHSGGGNDATKSLYIKFRVAQLHEQIMTASKAFKMAIQNNEPVTCTKCGHYDKVLKESRGDTALCYLLYVLFIVPGIIYTLCYSGYCYKCSKCRSVLHEDSIKAIE